jgi:hypothetical protein
VAQVAAESVQLPDDECIAGLERFQAGGKARSGVAAAGGEVLIDALRIDAGRQ